MRLPLPCLVHSFHAFPFAAVERALLLKTSAIEVDGSLHGLLLKSNRPASSDRAVGTDFLPAGDHDEHKEAVQHANTAEAGTKKDG